MSLLGESSPDRGATTGETLMASTSSCLEACVRDGERNLKADRLHMSPAPEHGEAPPSLRRSSRAHLDVHFDEWIKGSQLRRVGGFFQRIVEPERSAFADSEPDWKELQKILVPVRIEAARGKEPR
jgi:hypothetical protein